jgi:phytoene synthase
MGLSQFQITLYIKVIQTLEKRVLNKLTYESITEDYLKSSPLEVMSMHGKSFYFASMVFSKKRLFKIATLYKLCRFIDDCADELEKAESKRAIYNIISDLDNPDRDTKFNKLVREVEAWGVERPYIKELVVGAHFDAEGGRIYKMNDLMLYCYRVAGVVGLMMCPLIGVSDKRAYPHAIDLGLGMQLTNITRDILEDAKMGRIYLPEDKVHSLGQSLLTLSIKGRTPEELKTLVKSILDTADNYYLSAYEGLSYIPFRPRLVILLAGEVYRHIGQKIRRDGYNVLDGRTYLSLGEKLVVTFKTMGRLASSYFWNPKRHSKNLHNFIKEVPGANA